MWLAFTILGSADLDKWWVMESLNARSKDLDFILYEMESNLRLLYEVQGAGNGDRETSWRWL